MMIPLIAGPPTMGACTAEGCPSGWITPGDTRAEEDNVNEAVQQLDSDMRAAASVSLLQAWALFKTEWDGFYAGQGGLFGWLDRFATATGYEKTLDYRKQLESWRGRYMQEGGNPSGPGLVSRPPPAPDAIGTYLRWGAIIAAVGGGIYLLSIFRGPLTALVSRTNPGRRRRRRRRR
jgi:hypothetical protein